MFISANNREKNGNTHTYHRVMEKRCVAAGLTPRAALEQLAGIQMIDVHLPVNDGRYLVKHGHSMAKATSYLHYRKK